MKNQITLFLALIFNLICYSQISFEKGYYINNSDQKIDCLIKNVDWKNNPTEFTYRVSQNSEQQKATIADVKEFGISNTSKYSRHVVKIDRSSDNLSELSENKNPVFNEEQVFLKVLVEGKASLYFYADGSLERFFYNKENTNIEQLIFKSYKTDDNYVGENNYFRQQLLVNLKYPAFSINKIKNLKYSKNDLVHYFIGFNAYNNSEFMNFEKKQKRNSFKLSLRPGFNSSSLFIDNSDVYLVDANLENEVGLSFGNEFNFRFGVEAEFVLPFNKNKWAIIVEPTYQYHKTKKTFDLFHVNGKIVTADVSYKSIEIPLGLRHYFFLKNNLSIFINASFIHDYPNKSEVKFTRPDGSNNLFGNNEPLKVKSRNNMALGIGFKYKKRYCLEFRHQTDREILGDNLSWHSDYKTFSIIFGYTL